MRMIDRFKRGAEMTRRNEILEGKYPQLENYRNREFLSLGFPEMYMLAKDTYYSALGNTTELLEQYINHFGDNKDEYIVTNHMVLFKNQDKALEVFGDTLYTYNYFEDLIESITECYPDTSLEAMKGIAYNTYKCIKEGKFNQKVLFYMIETINKHVNLWRDNKTNEIRINSSQRLKDVMVPPYNTPKIEQVKIEAVEGDLNDVERALDNRVKELSTCVDAIEADLELRAKLKKKEKRKKKVLNEFGAIEEDEIDIENNLFESSVEDLQTLLYNATSVLSNKVKKIENDILNIDALTELDMLQRYRGSYEPMNKIALKTKFLIEDTMPKADKVLYNSNRSNSAKNDKNEDKIGRIREEFIRKVKLEKYKLKYVQHLIDKGFQSKDAYFSELM